MEKQMMTKRNQAILAFALLLLFDLVCAIYVCHKRPFTMQGDMAYSLGATEFAAKHQITSAFEPIGFGVLVGIGAVFGGWGGMTVVAVISSLLVVVVAWMYVLERGGTARAAFVLTLLLSLNPDFLLSYHKVQDTAVTAASLLGFVALLKWLVEKDRGWKADLWMGLLLGFAVLCRSNLIVLLPIVLLVYWRYRVPGAMRRIGLQAAVFAVVYVCVTTAVHGSVFWPQNGPYNVYSGFNEFTEAHLTNQEDSLVTALKVHHVAFTDLHNYTELNGAYRRLAVEYISQHPMQAVRLVGLKFDNMMLPDYRMYRARSVGGVIKTVEALPFPLWILGMILFKEKGPVRMIVALTVCFYIAPFLFTVSSPRFREPLDLLLWMEVGRMAICGHWRWRSEEMRVA